MKTTHYLISIGLLFGAFAPAFGQSTASCGGKQPVGYLGISGIDCDCTITTPGSGKEWRFRTEPRITSLEMDSRAGAVLKIGDVITHVNGKSIRTTEGANALSEIEPGHAVVLTVRRSGQVLKFALTAESACPTDSRLLGIYAPATRPGAAAYARVTPAPRPAVTPRAPSAARIAAQAQAAAHATAVSRPDVSFGMGLACSGNCSIHISDNNGVRTMKFSQPPEVYSIEKSGPADRAGIKRGDIITHINGKPMDDDEGGRLFANARAGETVRFTIQRGHERKTLSVKAVSRNTPMPALAQSTASLERARESLTQLQREQDSQMRKLQEAVRQSGRMEQEKLREIQREMLEQEREHKEKLTELARELSRADGRVRAATVAPGGSCAVPSHAPMAPGTTSRTLRYSGSLGESDIEVRGSNPVSVTETRDEVVISTGGTVVRVKKGKI